MRCNSFIVSENSVGSRNFCIKSNRPLHCNFKLHDALSIKETLTRDFQVFFCFHQTTSPDTRVKALSNISSISLIFDYEIANP
jgi:hypothetical protein